MQFRTTPIAAALLAACSSGAFAQEMADAPLKTLGTVTVTSGRPSSLPTQIPTTIEGISAAQIADKINATDSEDALKYFPSLNVRKRFIGDYDHAVLASRASGTGNSARSLVYADGILLSNLLGNGANYTPRWGLVSPEEIARVDVLYGPFSAAYPGNSVGAVVDYVTRMPKQFEAHAKLSGFSQAYQQYGTDTTYTGKQASASLGDRNGAWAWWLDVSRLDNNGQPIAFANKLLSSGTIGSGGTPVTGTIADKNPANKDWLILGSTNQVHTIQDHAKAKLAYDFSPVIRASYTLGWWRNDAVRSADSYLRDPSGNPVYSGNINVNGRQFTLTPAHIAPSRAQLEHVMHGLSIKSNTKGVWDWELAASRYDYAKDQQRTPGGALPASNQGGAGSITDLNGTGWNTLALKATWRSDDQLGIRSAHVVDVGYQRDSYQLRTLVSSTPDWINGTAAARSSAFNGNTQLGSLYAQDTWRIAPDWKTTLGGRLEQWQAFGGELSNASTTRTFGERKETSFSPKAALAYQVAPDWALKASLGRAVRNPSVAELYQGALVANTIVNNDPNLRPEKSWTSELTAEHNLNSGEMHGTLRATFFHENTRDALYSQTNVTVSPNVTNIQNVDRIRTSGLELAYQASDVGLAGLDLSASLTYAHSIIAANDKFPASVGQWQPRVPQWRANLVATYQPDSTWAYTVGARYSGKQFGTLDNSDPNGATYTGVSSFFVTDVRIRYRVAKQWTAAVGIDNLNNATYWAFHPYTQRTLVAELKFDL
ncbi:TonB-dependent receptor [Undibacterium arcticum]|uniref:TonB-dependent receptor n=1 Tax=Undibacterium arcticum TaxID=1762892 RepID=A0ABV7F7E7_9BURK